MKGKIWRLLSKMYKHVTNKILFGCVESDWYEQEYGLKQGCVISPALFNVLMNELTSEFDKSGIGARLINDILNSLLFADDIVQIADTETNLEKLFEIIHKFAESWNLNINHSKSKVMVIGKRLPDRVWKISNLSLKETNEYKTPGIYFTRSLRSYYHIGSYIKDKVEAKMNGMIRI